MNTHLETDNSHSINDSGQPPPSPPPPDRGKGWGARFRRWRTEQKEEWSAGFHQRPVMHSHYVLHYIAYAIGKVWQGLSYVGNAVKGLFGRVSREAPTPSQAVDVTARQRFTSTPPPSPAPAPPPPIEPPPRHTIVRQEFSQIEETLNLVIAVEEQITSEKLPPSATLDELRDKVHELRQRLLGSEDSASASTIEELESSIEQLMHDLRDQIAGDRAGLASFGKKHGNNILLGRLAEALAIPNVNVPASAGVNNATITDFLKKIAPDALHEWDALCAKYEQYEGEERFLETVEAQAHLELLGIIIEQAFAREDAFEQLNPSPEVAAMIEQVAQEGNYLMVRSTGAEDIAGAANAGGNISVEYVVPNRQAWCEAVGKVVCSYFSYGSLQNRLTAGQIPFRQPLQLAVTTQPLIGEEVGGASATKDIPVSLVVFSDEPLYTANESFRVMRISASYGHGNGVVGNVGIATDTILLLASETTGKLYILYDNKDKPYRLAPVHNPATGEVELDRVANPEKLRRTRALSKEQLAQMYHWSVTVEKFFGDRATDQEFIMKDGILHAVQARPVTRPDLLPTYLDLRKVAAAPESPVTESLRAELLVPGTASYTRITSPDSVLVTSTLAEAEQLYDSTRHQLVIVQQQEPANSHPVVNFSDLGVPCFVAHDREGVEALLAKVGHGHTIATCVQTATLYLWDDAKGDSEDFVSKGFAVHPAKIAPSIPTPLQGPVSKPLREIPQEVTDLLTEIRLATTQEVALEKLKELKRSSWVSEVKLQKRVAKQHLTTEDSLTPAVRERFEAIAAFSKVLKRAFKEAKATTEGAQPDERLKPLFHVNVLEALLVGREEKTGSLGQLSVVEVNALSAEAQQLIDYQKELSHPSHLIEFLLVGNKAFSALGQADWRTFLLNLDRSIESRTVPQEQVKRFVALMHTLQKAEVLPIWLTFHFSPLYRESHSWLSGLKSAYNGLSTYFGWEPKEDPLLNRLMETLPSSEQPFIDSQTHLRDQLRALRHQSHCFSDPKTFDAAWNALRAHLDPEVQKRFCDEMQKASPMARATALVTMNELVETLDSAIKSMKSGPKEQRDAQAKIKLMREMLAPCHELFQVWHNALPLYAQAKAESYLRLLKQQWNNLTNTDERQLRSSPDFSVGGAVFNSEAWVDRLLPQTLEDFFTLTHQNLLACIGVLGAEIFPEDLVAGSSLPDELKELMSAIPGRVIENKQVTRTLLEVRDEEVAVTYNVPLRAHSAQLVLKYDKASGAMTLAGRFYGDGLDRWMANSLLAEVCHREGYCPYAAPTRVGAQEVTVTWKVDDREELERLLALFTHMCHQANTWITTVRELPEWQPEWDLSLLDVVAKIVTKDPLPANKSAAMQVLLSNFSESMVPAALNLIRQIIATPDPDSNPQFYKIWLAIELVNRGHGYAEALEIASHPSTNPESKAALLQALVKQGQARDIAAAFCLEPADKKLNEDTIRIKIDLARLLILEGYHLDGIEEIFMHYWDFGSRYVTLSIRKLVLELVKKGQAHDLALKISDRDCLYKPDHRLVVLDTLMELVKAGKAEPSWPLFANMLMYLFDFKCGDDVGNLEEMKKMLRLLQAFLEHGIGQGLRDLILNDQLPYDWQWRTNVRNNPEVVALINAMRGE